MKQLKPKFCCPCCGWPGLDVPPYEKMGNPPWGDHGTPPYEDHYGMPSYDVCLCCGFEFGNDDNPGTGEPASFAEYLSTWKKEGCKWFRPGERPVGWSLDEQLKRSHIKKP